MSTVSILRGKRLMLSVCASVAAIVAATPSRAADINWTKSPVADRGEFRAFIEGGAFATGGDRVPYCGVRPEVGGDHGGLISCDGVFELGSIPSARPDWGWDAAIGFDYRFAGTPWHVNMQGRYGRTTKIKGGDTSFLATAFDNPCVGCDKDSATAVTTPSLKESHWTADFGMGYDFLRGMQINFGFRIAEVKSTMTAITAGSSVSVDSEGAVFNRTTDSIVQTDRRSFFGAGPRVGVEGSVPVFGAWTFDYSGNAAILFGNTKLDTGQIRSFTNFAVDGDGSSATGRMAHDLIWSAPNTVWNYDIQAGFGYWIAPNWKLVVSYRLDAFVDVLRVAPDDGATNSSIGPGRSMDRYYHGPKAALKARF